MAKIKEKNGEPRTNRYSVAPFIKEFYNEYYSIEEYPEEKCAAFNTIAGKWGIFGNFANTPLVIDGVPFKSSEHLFQTMKFKDADIVKKVYIGKCTNFFQKIGVAEFLLEAQTLSVGDEILVTGETTGAYEDVIEEVRVDLKPVEIVEKGTYFSIKTKDVVRRNDKLFKIVPADELQK